MSFLFGSKKEKLVAIFDIGSGSVSGAIVSIPFDNKDIPKIIRAINNEIKIDKNVDLKSLINQMNLTLHQTATQLYNKKIGAPEEIFCFFSSPWYISETKKIKIKQDKTFVFNKSLADELIKKEILNFTEVYKNKYSNIDNQAEVMEQHITSISLNGYPVDNPIGVKCQSVEINMIISLSPKICLDKIRETLSKTFHHIKINFSSFTLATFFAIRDKYIGEKSYLLIDISGEITDVGIVTDGALRAILSFPFGKNKFFRYIYTKLEIELRDAKELFKLYSNGNLSIEFKEKVDPLFNSIENSWGEAFAECLNTLPHALILPNVIFLTADNDIKNWFAGVLSNSNFTQFLPSKYKVITLDGPEFLNMCEYKNGPCDPFLMVEAISVMRKMIK